MDVVSGHTSAAAQPATQRSSDVTDRHVLHFGPDVHEPGGMANVISAYLVADLSPWLIQAVPSYASGSRLRWALSLLGALRVMALTSRHRVAGVHLHVSERFDILRSLALIEIATRRHIPGVLTLHGADFMTEVRKRPRLVAALLRRATAVTVLSPEVQNAVRRLGAKDVRLIANPAPEHGEVRDVTQSTQVLFAGEIGRRKGVDVLLEAWPAIRASRPDLTLRLAGPAAEPQLIARLPSGVAYAGVLSPEDVRRELAASCLAVLPSRAEQMPMFILEALAAGVPVVATAVGANELLVGPAGTIVPASDADALASAVVELLDDP